MEKVVLDATHAGDWTYRGEGAANLVLAYSGSSPRFVGKVLRVHKVSRSDSECENALTALTIHECLLWKEIDDLVLAPTREFAEHLYVQHVMCPLLGTDHVDSGTCVFVAKEFLEAVESNVLSQRPSWRINDAISNTQCESALLLSDVSVFPRSTLKDEFCISVEIKPKCGFLPASRFIADENYVKRCITRFKMHQALKLHQGKVSKISEYDPLDLFSGSLETVNKAMKDLIVTPQNNLRVFLNGTLIFGGSGGLADPTCCLNEELLEDALKCVIQAEDGMRTTNFLHLVAEAVCRPGLLDRLLEVQKLDKLDIEGAIHAYYNVISQPCPICRVFKENKKKLLERYTSLHSDPLSKSLKIVKDYLIAATAKDLSIMISFRPTEKRVMGSSNDIVSLKLNSQCFEYKASFIDLDMKPLKKMAYYFELDQKIVRHYSQMVKSNIYSERVASIKDTLHHEQTSAVEDVSHTRDSSVIGA
ncbi:hypothetical protein ACET3Z_010145 [Daucus carota]